MPDVYRVDLNTPEGHWVTLKSGPEPRWCGVDLKDVERDVHVRAED